MKTYIELEKFLFNDNVYIPKDDSNGQYLQILEDIKNGLAEIVPQPPFKYIEWEQVKSQRDFLLQKSDWVVLTDVNVPNKQAWLDYRQALRDIPQTYPTPEEVVWPQKPLK